MKKMLAKAVALSLVLGGVGFVSNNALAAKIGPALDVGGQSVLSYKDGLVINDDVEKMKQTLLPIKQTLLPIKQISLLTKKQLKMKKKLVNLTA